MSKPKLRFPEFSAEWNELELGDIVVQNIEPIPMPKTGYTRVGIYCHARGTFQEYVPEGKGLDVDVMYVVHKDNLIVNITFAWEHAIAITKPEDEGKVVSHRFPTYKFNEGHLPEFYRYLILDKRMEYHLMVASPGGAGRNRVLNKTEFLKIPVNVPETKEQKKIADAISSIEDVITLIEKEVALWEEKKKGVMQKIFSQEVRFKKEDGVDYPEWKSGTFKDIFEILKNNTLSRAELNYEEGYAQNIHYGDVLTKYPFVLDVKKDVIPYITDKDMAKKVERMSLKNGDVIISDTAEDETVGKATEITNLHDEILVSGLHTIPIRPSSIQFELGYLGYFINSNSYHDQLKPLMQGIKVTSISKGAIQDTTISYPCVEEQRKIVNCLLAIDETIQLKKQKLATWRTIKKGLLQQMFV